MSVLMMLRFVLSTYTYTYTYVHTHVPYPHLHPRSHPNPDLGYFRKFGKGGLSPFGGGCWIWRATKKKKETTGKVAECSRAWILSARER